MASAAPASAGKLSRQAFEAIAENCAPGVALHILEKIVRSESGFNPFAIGVNGPDRRSYDPASAAEAAAVSRELISKGESIDMGLGQINSANLAWLGLTPETVFDPCKNLEASAKVLRDGYERAREAGASREDALGKALSAYNTGSFTRGFTNGYVARVLGGNGTGRQHSADRPPVTAATADAATRWDVFGSSGTSAALVFQ
ncbi:lytic transglycosylase domain-containing protein [Leisingera sp. M527]|uniref:lytic transglycosylase domain-containing protein n=1 Tax=Leisingera sp. M527 TaxID=2867014 RepID=UPI0021A2D44F|nr:lytic transglycosylase domain-containing protein [Leisingera sp. M527]